MLCQKQFHGPVISQARILIRKAMALVPGKEIVDVKAETPTGASDGVGLCLGNARMLASWKISSGAHNRLSRARGDRSFIC